MFEKIKYYYNLGLYKKKHLDKLLASGALTEKEYSELLTTQEE